MIARDFIGKTYLEALIDKFANQDRKVVLFFKGFSPIFYSSLDNYAAYLGNNACLNKEQYIDILFLEDKEYQRQLVRSVMSLKNKISWGFYEEYIALSDQLQSIKDMVDGIVYIVDNNLFNESYPLEVGSNYKELLYDYYNSDDLCTDCELDCLVKYYSNASCVRAEGYEKIFLSFVNRYQDDAVTAINLYPHRDFDFSEIDDKATITISANDALIDCFKDKLQQGMDIPALNISLDKRDIDSIKTFVSLCGINDIPVKLFLNNHLLKVRNLSNERYKDVLTKYWGEKAAFRELSFYKNPDKDNELITVSQGDIVADIICQSEKAFQGSLDYSDIFLTAPTGSGKSLLFQLPAVYLAGKYNVVSVVVSPLIALMRDQVEALQGRGVWLSTFINSDITFDEKERRLSLIRDGKYSLVYLSPEMLLSNSIESIVGDRHIGLMVIDEAHLVTSWGRDFRSDYWYLGDYIERLRKRNGKHFPILCLTATAKYMGQDDVVLDT
ncbi:MAG: DEAD/DEAH box helicase, partial [bacterium]|nr:DEAD/DEAH box helicase [bacterium]